MSNSIERLDPAMARKDPQGDFTWYDARGLGVEGKGWEDTARHYDRLPADAEGVVPDAVWTLSHHSAGMYVRFVTDSAKIACRWQLLNESLAMPHMPATGVSGVDLYGRREDSWHFAGGGRPTEFPENQSQLIGGLDGSMRQFMLYLPLYNGVEKVEIGVDPDASVSRAPAWECADARPMVFYGTSVVQGGCASRPGMVHTGIISRRLNRPAINLGFSGNGRSEPEVARLLAQIDASVFVIDPLPNMSEELVTERIGPLIRTIRKAQPTVPLVVVENLFPQNAVFREDAIEAWAAKNQALRVVYDQLEAEGFDRMWYIRGADLFKHDGDATVDGVHATDLGYIRMADAMCPVLREIEQTVG